MTSVVCWFDQSEGVPWCVSDSRFSYPEATIPLLDEGAKVISFPVTIRQRWGKGKVIYSANIGVAFAGNTIVGHNTILCASAICTALTKHPEDTSMLSLADIAHLVAKLSYRFTKMLGQSRPNSWATEFAICGWCPKAEHWKIFHIHPNSRSEPSPMIEEFLPGDNEDLLLLGDQQNEVRMAITRIRAGCGNLKAEWWQAPLRAIYELTSNSLYPSIGGYPQLGVGVGDTNDFELSAIVPIPSVDILKPSFRFLGMDTETDIGRVGSCSIGMTGLIFDASKQVGN